MMDGGDGKRLTSSNLNLAFMDMEDLLQRCLLPFILLGNTAKSALKGKLLTNEIQVGVKENELTKQAISTLKTLEKDIVETEKGYTYTKNGIKINILKLDQNNRFYQNPDAFFYQGSEYLIPNPFHEYWEARND